MLDTSLGIIYMIQYGDINSNVDTDKIPSLLDEWYVEYCMGATSIFHMREYYVLKFRSHDPDTPTYMEALSGEHADEYYKYMDDEIKSLTKRENMDIVLRKSVDDKDVIPGTWYLKYNRKHDRKNRKFKARYCVKGYV